MNSTTADAILPLSVNRSLNTRSRPLETPRNLAAVYCPICEQSFRHFLPFGYIERSNAQCPNCLSLERHRLLWLFFKAYFPTEKISGFQILHCAPERSFYDYFNQLKGITYHPCDIAPENYQPMQIERVDLTQIDFPDRFFDLIICSHVLEHIPDVDQALSELRRVLKSSGQAILEVPVDRSLESTVEDLSVTDPAERLKRYGSPYHVRQYGKDFPQILQKAGFKVKVIPFSDQYSMPEKHKYGLHENVNIYLVSSR